MNIYSYQARLKKINPRLRLRVQRPTYGFGCWLQRAGLYRGTRYEGFTLSSGWVEAVSQEHQKETRYVEARKEWVKTFKGWGRRGRKEFLRLLIGNRVIGTKAARQLLSL